MEKFSVYHNNKHKCRNRAEYLMVGYIKKLLAEPTDKTIEQIYQWCIDTANNIEKSKGKVTFSRLHKTGSIAGQPNWVIRGFGMYGTGRNTHTLSVSEELFKDADDNYSVVKCTLNNNL